MPAKCGVTPLTISTSGPGYVVIDPVCPDDTVATVAVYDHTGDGPSVNLTPAKLRHVAAQLVRRADVLDGKDGAE